jgi:choline dehydrogenase-like flavoprotein
LRSGIGGPAVGKYLRLHPVAGLVGVYGEDQRAWWGPPHSVAIDEFADPGDGYGFLIEGAQYTTGASAAFIPLSSGAQHKELLSVSANASWAIALVRDHGYGEVTIDANGEAVPYYAVTDEVDLANLRRGVDALARAHRAAGAIQIATLADGLPTWRWGEDLDAYVARIHAIPFRFGGYRMFSAHQMGSCRMGADPRTSVAGPYGELHDAPGVWIGDGSGFPTASGVNPMITIMALAHRTADAIAAAAGKPRADVTAKA